MLLFARFTREEANGWCYQKTKRFLYPHGNFNKRESRKTRKSMTGNEYYHNEQTNCISFQLRLIVRLDSPNRVRIIWVSRANRSRIACVSDGNRWIIACTTLLRNDSTPSVIATTLSLLSCLRKWLKREGGWRLYWPSSDRCIPMGPLVLLQKRLLIKREKIL